MMSRGFRWDGPVTEPPGDGRGFPSLFYNWNTVTYLFSEWSNLKYLCLILLMYSYAMHSYAHETSFNSTKYMMLSFIISLNWRFYVHVVKMWLEHGEVKSNIMDILQIYEVKSALITNGEITRNETERNGTKWKELIKWNEFTSIILLNNRISLHGRIRRL